MICMVDRYCPYCLFSPVDLDARKMARRGSRTLSVLVEHPSCIERPARADEEGRSAGRRHNCEPEATREARRSWCVHGHLARWTLRQDFCVSCKLADAVPRCSSLFLVDHGATVSSFVSIALSPQPLVAFALRLPSRLATFLQNASHEKPTFRIHLLGQDQEQLARAFARQPPPPQKAVPSPQPADATATPPTTSAKATPRWSSEDDLQALVLSSSITELDMSLEAVSLLIFAVQVGLAAFPSLQYAIDC